MSFVGSMFDSSKGTGFQAQAVPLQQAVTQAQTDQAYKDTQNALAQQQAFVNAVGAQGGLQNQSNVYNQLAQISQGQGYNPAQAMLNQTTGANAAQQAALMASQRGTAANPGLIARQIARQGADVQQQAAGQAATLQAQQSLGALGQMGGLATQQVGQQQGALSTYNQAAQNQQQNLLNAVAQYNSTQVGQQNAMNAANAQIAGINAQNQAQFFGGALQGLGVGAQSFGGGGGGGGLPPAALLAAAKGGIVPGYADGGEVDPTNTNSPQSSVGKFFQGFGKGFQSAYQTSPNQNSGMFQGAQGVGKGIGQGLASGIKGIGNLFGSSSNDTSNNNIPELDFNNVPKFNPTLPPSAMGTVPLSHGGMPTQDMTQGGKVPGKAQIKGDSYRNDTVPAMLSPKEIVIPRSIAMHENAGELAKQFVENELKKNRYAEGGDVKEASSPTININVPQGPQPNNEPQGPMPEPQSVYVNPNALRNQMFASNKNLPQNQFSEEYQPKYTYDPQGTMQQPQTPAAQKFQNYALPQSQPQDSSLTNKLPQAEEIAGPVNQQIEALQKEAEIKGELGRTQAALAQRRAQEQQNALKNAQFQLSQNTKEVNDVIKDYQEGHINPNHFMEGKNAIQKVSTAIGLILGGIGGALTHQESAPLKFLNAQIDRDIHAQQADLDKKNNLLTANFRKFGNLEDATKMTQAMQYGIYATKLEQAAAQTQDPLEKQRALAAAAQLKGQIAPTLQQISVRNALLGQNAASQNVDPAVAARFLAPPELQKEAIKEAGEYKGLLKAQSNLLNAFDKLDKLNTLGNRISHFGTTPAAVSAIRDPLIAGLSKETAGRFTEQDANYIASLFPAPGDTKATIGEKKAALNNLISQKMSGFGALQSIGVNTTPREYAQKNQNVTPNYVARR